jgi:hypothetical protein
MYGELNPAFQRKYLKDILRETEEKMGRWFMVPCY